MLESVKDINPEQMGSEKELKETVIFLLNVVEGMQQEMAGLKLDNQQLRDENNRLKGGNARPVFKGQKKNLRFGDISSKGKEKGNIGKGKNKGNGDEDRGAIGIDQEIKVDMDKSQLPDDAVFKGFKEYIQQDITVKRNNKRFLFASYYSAREGKSYHAPFPQGEVEGHFGVGVSSLVNVLYHYGNVTESKMGGLLEGFGVRISAGGISNMLKQEHDWAVKEQGDILAAGLENSAPKQMDCTGNRQRGVNKVTHIITDPSFSVFYTLSSKSRIDCLRALQGNPGPGMLLKWHQDMEPQWRAAGVSMPDCSKVMGLLKENGPQILSITAFEDLASKQVPNIYKKKRIVHILTESMALHYYRQQCDFKPLEVLLTDDAPEYCKIAPFQGLCWVHDARYYNKLQPLIKFNAYLLDTFKTTYWNFYRRLLDFKTLPACQQPEEKENIEKNFDEIFGQATYYGALDLCIERTRNNKEKLLMVLDFPNIPLHNNAAELAARRVVRKRDISLHTWTDWGTELRDAFLSIIETARKMGISAYHYIKNHISGDNNIPTLAQLIVNGTANRAP